MRHLITAGLPYINGIKHMGNLVGSMLPADVYARFLRQNGHEVLYICATDEHGTPAEIAANQAGKSVEDYCEQMHLVQASIYQKFDISFDFFGRSSSGSNKHLTQLIARQLEGNGYLETRTTEQIYSEDDKRFLPDRYVGGTCPFCGYAEARGDQCESCTKLLDPEDLINPYSTISGSTKLEMRQTRHLFLKLPELTERLEKWVEGQLDNWPSLTRSIAQKWLAEGLRDRCITRDLDWGIPVPFPGLEDKVFYVWFDAPIEYIGATREWSEQSPDPDSWESWWINPDDVQYTQFMGKDNLPFHTIMFPAMLLGTGFPWKMADQIKGFHWLEYYNGKFSTSLQRGVFTDVALELFPSDYWRYSLMAMIPETGDSCFTWERFAQIINKDLAGTLGNFVNRVLRFSSSQFGLTVPEGGEPGSREAKLAEDCAACVGAYEEALLRLEFRTAMRELKSLWTAGNVYIDEMAPWKVIKTNPEHAAMVVRTCFNLVRLYAVAGSSIIPNLSGQILAALNLTDEESSLPLREHCNLDMLKPGRLFTLIEPLVVPIQEERIIELRDRFGS